MCPVNVYFTPATFHGLISVDRTPFLLFPWNRPYGVRGFSLENTVLLPRERRGRIPTGQDGVMVEKR